MSEIVERTFASFLSSSLLGGSKTGPLKQSAPPRGLQTLLRAVDSAQSRSEEEAVVQKELALFKQRLNQPGATPGQLRDLLPRIIFCSVIGYDVSFCSIHAVKLAAQAGSGMEKRAGYLAATLLLHSGEEITILMMGTLMKDLSSSNMVDNCLALTAAAYLVAAEHIPLLLPAVLKCLNHKRELVREKSVHCLHAFFLRAPSLMSHVLPQLCGMLQDKDPGVLSALVSVIVSLAPKHMDTFLPLRKSLLNVLQQVRSRRFPSSHDYHGMPLPWLQMNLLKVLTVLSSRDLLLMSTALPTLSGILRDINPRESISLAVAYQCVLAVAQMGKSVFKAGRNSSVDGASPGVSQNFREYTGTANTVEDNLAGGSGAQRPAGKEPSAQQSWAEGSLPAGIMPELQNQLQPLLHQASQCVASFLQSNVRNLRYLGVKSLAHLVAANPELAADHQTAVVKCLDDPDPAIRHQTLTLLHHMANPANVKVISSKLLEYMHQKNVDANMQADLARMLCDLAGKFATDPQWYVDTLLPILTLNLKPQVLSFIADCMLKYLVSASKQDAWPKFSRLLFSQVVQAVLRGERASNITTMHFALRVLKFVPMDGCAFDQMGFLSACQRILETDAHSMDVKELTVLCVQHLMLSGKLESSKVIEWLRAFTAGQNQLSCQTQVNSMDLYFGRTQADSFDLLPAAADQKSQPAFSFPRKIRKLLEELHAVSSLQCKGHTFVPIKTPSTMDFTLSFADAYVSEVLEKGQPLLKKHVPKSREEVVPSLMPETDDRSSVSPPSQTSLSTSSRQGEMSRQDSMSVHTDRSTAGDGLGVSSAISSLKNIPGVKQVWSKQGVVIGQDKLSLSTQTAALKKGQNTSEMQDTQGFGMQKQENEQELARALFQGVSSKASEPMSQSVPPSSATRAPARKERETWETAEAETILPKGDSGGWRALHKTLNSEQVQGTGDASSTGSTNGAYAPSRNSDKPAADAVSLQNQNKLEDGDKRENASSVGLSGSGQSMAEPNLSLAETPVLPQAGLGFQPMTNQLSETRQESWLITNQLSHAGQKTWPMADQLSGQETEPVTDRLSEARAGLQEMNIMHADDAAAALFSTNANNFGGVQPEAASSLSSENLQFPGDSLAAEGGNLYSEFLSADFSDLSDMEAEDQETGDKEYEHTAEWQGQGEPIREREGVKSDFYSEYMLSSSPLNPDG